MTLLQPHKRVAASLLNNEFVHLLSNTANEFSSDKCSSMAAALAYYSVFALPGFLVLVLALTGMLVEPADIQGMLTEGIGKVVGQSGADLIKTMIETSAMHGNGPAGALTGFITLAFGATGIVVELQRALNTAWGVAEKASSLGIRLFIIKRVLSFAMILAIAFLLLISLVLSIALSALGGHITSLLPSAFSGYLLLGLNFTLTVFVNTLLFASMFKFLPDEQIAWHEVWIGALATAVLFEIGKFAIGFYLGKKNIGSAFGAAGSLALILFWVYYSCMILLFGAEFTQVWGKEHHRSTA